MRVLITGITGFVGSHMADYLIKNVPNVEIFAIRRWRSRDDNIKHLYSSGKYGDDKQDHIQFIEADLLDRGSLANAIQIAKPDLVYHFAAQSFPESSFLTPVSTLTTNIIGTTNLFEELRLAKERNYCNPIIVSVSSSEVYGNALKDEVPITERNPIRAANPYSISKVIASVLVDKDIKNVTCFDPSAGSGTLLMNIAHKIGVDKCSIYSQDISLKSSNLLRLNLILNNLVHSIQNVVLPGKSKNSDLAG